MSAFSSERKRAGSQGCPESRPVDIPNCLCLLKVHGGGSGAGTVLRKPAITPISCLVEDVISGWEEIPQGWGSFLSTPCGSTASHPS